MSTDTQGQQQPASSAVPSVEWIRDFTMRWYDAWNAHDIDRVIALMAPDIEYRDDGWPTTMHGHAQVREFLAAFWRAFPDTAFEVVAGPYVIPGEARAATHWRGTGTHNGRFDPPGIGPTGRRWDLEGVDFQEYRDGLVCKLRISCDTLDCARQLGLLPASGGRLEGLVALLQRIAAHGQRRMIRGRSR